MMDDVALEMLSKAIEDAGCWILFFCQLAGLYAALLLLLLFGGLALCALWRFLVMNTVNRVIACIERKAFQ